MYIVLFDHIFMHIFSVGSYWPTHLYCLGLFFEMAVLVAPSGVTKLQPSGDKGGIVFPIPTLSESSS